MWRLPDVEVQYEEYSNRQLVAAPLLILAVGLLVIGGTWAVTGAPADPGIDFTGGAQLIVETDASQSEIRSAFSREPDRIQPSRVADRATVEFKDEGDIDRATLDRLAEDAEAAGFVVVDRGFTDASFGADSQREAVIGVAIAFLGMSLLVAIVFRTFIPSIAIVASAFSDLIIPIALMNLLGIELSFGTVAALLMLIGYSVDSDILLNNQVLRRRGGFYESVQRAMRTGVTMTVTSIAAMIMMTVVATILQVPLLPAVGIVLVFGLTADLMNTYLMNLSLLRYYRYEAVRS